MKVIIGGDKNEYIKKMNQFLSNKSCSVAVDQNNTINQKFS